MPLVHAAVVLPRCSQSTHLAVLMDRVHYPVDAWVPPNGLVTGVHENDFKELICGVLSYPVGVQHTESSTALASFLLRQRRKAV